MISTAPDGLYWCANGAGDRGICLHRSSVGPSVSRDIYGCNGMAMAILIHRGDATYMDKMSYSWIQQPFMGKRDTHGTVSPVSEVNIY